MRSGLLAAVAVIALLMADSRFAQADGRVSRGGGGRAAGGRTTLPGGYLRRGLAPTNFPGYNRGYQAIRSSQYSNFANGNSTRRFLSGINSTFRRGFGRNSYGVINRGSYVLPFSPGLLPSGRVYHGIDSASVDHAQELPPRVFQPKPRYYLEIAPPDPIPPMIFPRWPRPKVTEPPRPEF